MGGKQNPFPTLPRGVTIRSFKHEQRIQIAFSFQGANCRELLEPGSRITQGALNNAAGLRNEIRRKIFDGTFIYAQYFPESPRARLFGTPGRRCPLAERLALIERG